MGMHFAWNYLFDALMSVPVSGHAARGWIQVVPAGPEWLSGGAYGVEGSVVPAFETRPAEEQDVHGRRMPGPATEELR